jgi:hypothetical protein
METIYDIEPDRYDKIFSFVFQSKSESEFTLFVACRVRIENQQIEIYDIVAQNQKNRISALQNENA